MTRELTARQAEILQFIRQHQETRGLPPTREEIMQAFGFRSPNAAECHLRALARKGVIDMLPGTSRGIRIARSAGLPLVGRVAAGAPILAEQHVEDHFQLDPRLFRPHPDYLLRVHGDSMIDAGIHDGDLLAVHRSSEVRNGQIVVARLGDEVTVKRFQRRGERIQLLPANPRHQAIVVDPEMTSFHIEGIGVGVIRTKCR